MPIIASAAGGTDFAPAPSGPQQAVCSAVFDMGMEWSEQYKKHSQKVCVFFELAERMEDGRPFLLSKRYTLSLGEKANLRRDLEGWRGVPFTPEQLKAFDVEVLIGKNCYLNVIHQAKKQGTGMRALIAAIMPLPKGMPIITITSRDVPKWALESKMKNDAAYADHKAVHTSVDGDEETIVVTGAGSLDEPPF